MKPLVVLAILVLSACFAADAPNPEPVYQGKPITYWLTGLDYCKPSSGVERRQARAAVAAMGWPAVPYLLQHPWGNECLPEATFPLNSAVAAMKDQDKGRFETNLIVWLRDTNVLVKATAIALLPQRTKLTADQLSELRQLSARPRIDLPRPGLDPRLAQAVLGYWRRSLVPAGWEPDFGKPRSTVSSGGPSFPPWWNRNNEKAGAEAPAVRTK